nr:MAG TPA: hypothetical protein [Myoviridae sp. ctiIS8]DAO78866.1 MAG TPA: hypothetical protein [Caudoviricetes sp.]
MCMLFLLYHPFRCFCHLLAPFNDRMKSKY